ncbi:hypothetical protein BpHYR1_047333 [Brachionus plicatilis]|uniref:Uncharacterized protein n=1 Tax=Brachionus plicatilis TaxID=10195 RepID=A0A3M7QYP3_BRAPC|nr:hypothetical protein BpHYR1_047333 [Brachionus plicatilis]
MSEETYSSTSILALHQAQSNIDDTDNDASLIEEAVIHKKRGKDLSYEDFAVVLQKLVKKKSIMVFLKEIN